MNIKNIILASVLGMGAMTASAQENVKTEEVFNPHWYVQGQLGFQNTLGEVDWSDLNSFNFQVGGGYQFTDIWGLRLSINGANSKAGYKIAETGINYKWKWNYLAPSLDATFNLSNAIWGFNPKRVVDVSLLAGFGVNFAWANNGAAEADKAIKEYYATDNGVLSHLWSGNACYLVGRLGAMVDFNLNDKCSIGFEYNANVLNDHYNSKHAENADWYFNTLIGFKYKFGKTHTTRTTPLETTIVEKEVIRTVHDTIYINVEVPTAVKGEKIRRDVFFVIRGSEVSKAEMPKLEDVVAYLNKYPESKVTITGYADKGTGNASINKMYSQKRADMVADILKNKFGIAANRIVTTAKGDSEQPYEQNELNRVSIMVAE